MEPDLAIDIHYCGGKTISGHGPAQRGSESVVAANELWVTASALLRSQVSDGVWQSTFAQVAPIELLGDTFTLAVPNGFIRDRLDGRYRPLVEDAVTEASGL
ncbi:MAG: DnaA N-terminal domain-containing protein, partial [Acidimicrobiales bacterium]